MDDNQDLALNEVVEVENNETESPTVEEEATGDAEDVEAEADTESDETEGEPKKGFSSRVRELNARAKKAEAEAESLAEKLAALTGSTDNVGTYSPQTASDDPIVMPGEEIDALELDRRLRNREERILQRADALSTLRSKQNDAVNRINSEASQVMRKYPELDPDHENFNKELSDAITEAAEAHVKGAPYTASVINFVDKMMRPYKGAVSKGVGDMTKTVAKQVSEAALRPTSVRKQERPAAEKSIAELEAELGMLQA